MAREDENFLNDFLTEIADAKQPEIIPELKNVPLRVEESKPKYDDVVIKTPPETKPHLTFPMPTGNDTADDVNYDAWVNNLQNIRPDLFLSDKDEDLDTKTEIKPISDIKPKTEIFVPDTKPKTEIFYPEIKPKTEIILPKIKSSIKPFPINDK